MDATVAVVVVEELVETVGDADCSAVSVLVVVVVDIGGT